MGDLYDTVGLRFVGGRTANGGMQGRVGDPGERWE